MVVLGFLPIPIPTPLGLLVVGVVCVVFTINKIRSSNRKKWGGNRYTFKDKPKDKEKEGTDE
jgi:hypothetical protein